MNKYEQEFNQKIANLKKQVIEINNDPSFVFNLKKPLAENLIEIRSFSDIEHTKILNALIVPEWAFNSKVEAVENSIQDLSKYLSKSRNKDSFKTITLKNDLFSKIQQIAENNNLSVEELISNILKEYLKDKNK